jgi:phosphoribosylamine--glycine ligase
MFCAPGNAGIAEIARSVDIKPTEMQALADFSTQQGIDLTIVGPEVPLAAGIVDVFEDRRLPIVGPSRAAARLESSKAFAKDFMKRHGIPTAGYHTVESADEALRILKSGEFGQEDKPVVLKADGLAAGKGVIVAQSRKEAEDAVRELATGSISDAARKIVIEEALSGPEVSLLLFSDGKDFRLMPPARDHKRLGDNDTGPNTGGMGSITDAHILSNSDLNEIVKTIVQPTLEGARAEGFSFRGVLFIGLMMTPAGPRVLEYNVRFGDPETQAILVRLNSDLIEVCEAITTGRLDELSVQWSQKSSACVVLAARGYPGKPETGTRIEGLDAAARQHDVSIFHAATQKQNGEWLTSGGRVLAVTAAGDSLDEALSRCYGAVARIRWEGMQFRRDIGHSHG